MNVILAYHDVSPYVHGRPGTRTHCSLEVFREQVESIRQVAPVGTVLDLVAGRVRVAITFDDGYAGSRDAATVLSCCGLRATFFPVTSFVGQPGYLDWSDVWALKEEGMEIGFHTHSHVNLLSCNPRWKYEEIVSAKRTFEERLGDRVMGFCYPFGGHDDLCLDLAEKAGYRYAVTTITGYNDQYSYPMTLRRIGVRGDHRPDDLVRMVLPVVSGDAKERSTHTAAQGG